MTGSLQSRCRMRSHHSGGACDHDTHDLARLRLVGGEAPLAASGLVLFQPDGVFGTVGFAEAGLVYEFRRYPMRFDPAVPPLVFLEDLGPQCVTAPVAHAQCRVDPDLHLWVFQTRGRYWTSRMPEL